MAWLLLFIIFPAAILAARRRNADKHRTDQLPHGDIPAIPVSKHNAEYRQ